MRPIWKACERLTYAGLGSLCLSCAANPPLSGDVERRRPDGVAVDPLEYPPEPTEAADANAGVISLRTPIGSEAARASTRVLLGAISREDLSELRGVMTTDATVVNPSTRTRENAFYFFSRRFQRLDYLTLGNTPFFQEEQIELFRSDEGESLWSERVGASASPSATLASAQSDRLEPGDLLVRVPVAIPRPGANALLGDELLLLLRRSGGRYLVHRIVEEFSLPP